ncbi:DNA translocase FtsK 4TM domain-containing protein [Moraxella sp. ZJ142]|uniref:FtsK/SpoIIIE family DNA translocase n=1 Tax=Moraxella marmotae TaxID=3344520 RepID=UPI0035D3DB2E
MSNLFQSPAVAKFVESLPTIRKLIFSAFGIGLLIFLFLSLLSYNPDDSAWSHVSSNLTVSNVGGRLGAWIADILHAFFGFGAWFLVLALAYELVCQWWTHTKLIWAIRACAYGLLLLFVSALLSYAGGLQDAQAALTLGGAIGTTLQSNLADAFGEMPAVLLIIATIIVLSVLSFEIRWRALVQDVLFGWLDAKKTKTDETTDQDNDASVVLDDDEQTQMAVDLATPHNHKGALESFLRHSGLREELLAQRQAEQQAKQAALQAEQSSSSKQAALPKVRVVDMLEKAAVKPAEVLSQDSSPSHISSQISSDATDTQVAVKSAVQADFTQIENDEIAPVATDKTISQTADKDGAIQPSIHQTPKANITNETVADWVEYQPSADDAGVQAGKPKSHAMDTLTYRMSLSPIPELDLLDKPDLSKKPQVSQEALDKASELLEIKLQEYNIQAQVVSAMVGPVVTRFEVELAPGVKASRVTRIAQDLARSMSKASLRVVEVIPGKPYIGIEVPNKNRETVHLIELLDTPDYKDPNNQIAIAVGKDISGKPVIADLAKAPHMLVAGTTGSGKSVLVNAFLLSMLLKYTPDDLKLVLIDPKQLELANYGDIPHLLTPVITDMKDAVAALTWCVNEMERRYQLMSKLRVRKISEFNKKIEQAEHSGEPIFDPLWQMSDSVSQSKPPKLKALPTIVIVADEFADMIMQLGKTAEEPIVRLAQKARAAGIHLLLATQRPTVNVVTGLIKANVPARVALRVNSKVDSRTIIEEGGAEDMLGHGDMMFIGPGKNSPERMHGAYVDDDEVNRVCDAWRERGSPDYIDLSDSYTFEGEGSGDMNASSDGDELYEAAAAFVVETRRPSISAVQRKFSIGYNRAARLLDQMEERGLVSSMDSSGKRQLLL